VRFLRRNGKGCAAKAIGSYFLRKITESISWLGVFRQCQGKKEQFVLSCLASQRVGDFCMKCVRSLSGVALVSFLSFQPGVAMSKVVEQVQNPTQSTQTIAVDPLRIIERERRRLEREQRKWEREQRNEFRRQQRELRRLKRQQELERLEQRQKELEAARQAATEEQRLEAERRRQHFESLSPEDKKAYLAEQKARRIQANDQVAKLLGLMLMFTGGSGSSQQEGGRYVTCWEYGSDGSNKPFQVYVKAGERPPSSNCDG
jgi:hypothetical protein